MMLNMFDKGYIKQPWKTMYRRIKQYCNNSKARGYRDYGAEGITCDFTSSEEIKFLWERDKAKSIKSPYLRRKDTKKGYSIENCYFMEFINYVLDITNGHHLINKNKKR
jgi:hypothetical protein